MEKSEALNRLIDLLNRFTLTEQIELLANVFIRLGLSRIKDSGIEIPKAITAENLVPITAQYKKQYGETLEGAMLFQGITILMWLQNRR